MCFSVFNVTAVVSSAFDYDVKRLVSVNPSDFKDGKVTYTVKLASGLKSFVGTSVYVEYDSSVLAVSEDETGASYTVNASGARVDNFSGEYAKGPMKNQDGKYSFAFMSSGGITTTSKGIFTITFTVIDKTHPETTVDFYCREFTTLDGNDKNDITRLDPEQKFASITASTLDVPVIKNAKITDNGIKLFWDEVEGATGYTVIRKDADSVWENAGAVNAPAAEFTDEDVVCGEHYVYSLKAVNAFGESGFDSAGVNCAFAQKPVLSVANGNKAIVLSWLPIENVDGFRVYRREQGTENRVKVATLNASACIYQDKNIVSGKAYEYDVNSYVGSFETQSAEQGVTGIYVDFPEIQKLYNSLTGITLEWAEVENAEYYTVYRMAEDREDYSLIKTLDAGLGAKFTDTTAVAGKSCKYAVKATVDAIDSGLSETELFTRVNSTVITEVTNTEAGIYTKWQGIEDVDGYNVYRKEQNSVKWVLVGTVDADGFEYTDETAKSGKIYKFAVAPFIGECEGFYGDGTADFYYIKAPVCHAENRANGVYLSWEASDGAKSYTVYRADEKGNKEKIAENLEEPPFIDTTAVNGETYYYNLVAVGDNGVSPKGARSEAVCRMPAPEKFTVAVVNDGIKLSWSSVDVAEKYNIYRKTKTGLYENIASTSELTYTDTDCNSNTKYQYKICASFSGSEGVFTKESDFVTFLVAPKTVTAAVSSNGIKVTWSKVDGAKKYRVFKDGVSVGDTTAQNYVVSNLKSGTEYSFSVRPVNEDGALGGVSGTAKCIFITAPSITLSNGLTGVTVSFTKPAGTTYYELSRKASTEKTWTSLGKVDASKATYTDTSAESGKTYSYKAVAVSANSKSAEKVSGNLLYIAATKITAVATASTGIKITWSKVKGIKGYYIYRKTETGDWSRIKNALSTATSYTDTGAKKGVVYLYTIKPYNGSSTGISCTSVKAVRLVAPAVKVATGNGYVSVTWDAVTGAAGYTVYRKTGTGSWTALGKVAATVKSYKDTTAKSGTKYYYTVKAYNGSCPGLYKASSAIKYLSMPQLVSATSVSSGVTVKWTKVTGASGYYVYRKTGSGSYSRISNIKKGTTVSYTDKGAKKGTKYVYTVRAYSGSYVSAIPTGINGVKK